MLANEALYTCTLCHDTQVGLLICGWYRIIPGVKRPGRGVNHPPPSGAEVKERVDL